MRLHGTVHCLLAAVALGLGAGPAAAQIVTFVELADNTVLVQDDGKFTCGITSTASAERAHVVACMDVGGLGGMDGVGTACMVEPAGSTFPGSISDCINIRVARLGNSPQYQITLDFLSDDESDVPAYPPANFPVLVENGSPQLLNAFFRDAGGDRIALPGGAQVWAQSDVSDQPTPVLHTSWGMLKTLYR
jgi:hypothetical protein